ncbi:trypsin-like peptidase domain-containing protein [Thermogemmatispora sp.]|uniref:trypsin-like peptidase domain-containing protein n=1 Tax=Thermogemmatispora sp. TaxID=1968838 RepID=UPI002ACBEADC|nr:trypsin-like peptidase domain-containing protein [Thermogemmatispora sp.]
MNCYATISAGPSGSHPRERKANSRGLPSLLVVMFCFICGPVLLLTALEGPAARADGVPGGNVQDPVVRAVDIARPAVVRIVTQINGRLTVQFSGGRSVTFPLDGGSYGLAALGTGTFISAHGDILTADHVVNPPHNDELNAVLIKAAAPDVATYYNSTLARGNQLSADQMEQALLSGQFPSTPSYDPPVSAVYLSTDYSGPLSATRLRDVPDAYFARVDRVEQESPPDQKDVAIIHVNMEDTPSVQLGDSSAVQVQDNLTIIGFPGNADVSMRPTDFLTSSVNRIFVSSIKTTDSGAQVIQVGGNVEQGDSGGPALDSRGQVVGIVSFGTPGGTSFLQASNSARALIQNLQLNTAPGPFQTAWSQAFNDYASTAPGHWHRAAQEFATLAARYPAFKAVTPYLDYARQQAAHEQLSTTASQGQGAPLLLIVAGGLGAVVIVALLVGAVFQLRRRRRSAGISPVVNAASSQSYPYRAAQGQGTPPAWPSAPALYPSMPAGAQPPQAPARTPVPTGPSAAPGSQASWPAGPGSQPPGLSPSAALPSVSGPASQLPPAAKVAASSYPSPEPEDENTLVPFGGPPRDAGVRGQPRLSPGGQAAPPSIATGSQSPTEQLRPWPCGHLNRPHARYCSTCGEPAPPPPTVRWIEQ